MTWKLKCPLCPESVFWTEGLVILLSLSRMMWSLCSETCCGFPFLWESEAQVLSRAPGSRRSGCSWCQGPNFLPGAVCAVSAPAFLECARQFPISGRKLPPPLYHWLIITIIHFDFSYKLLFFQWDFIDSLWLKMKIFVSGKTLDSLLSAFLNIYYTVYSTSSPSSEYKLLKLVIFVCFSTEILVPVKE